MQIEIGDFVKVNSGVIDIDLPHHQIGDYQGQVLEVTVIEEDQPKVLIKWDSQTLLHQIPHEIIKEMIRMDMEWNIGVVYMHDISIASPRDTEEDVEQAEEHLIEQYIDYFIENSSHIGWLSNKMTAKDGKLNIEFMEDMQDYNVDQESLITLLISFKKAIIDLFIEISQSEAELDYTLDPTDAALCINLLLDVIYITLETPLKATTVATMQEALTEILPSNFEFFTPEFDLSNPEKVAEIIPVVRAFWQFLKREYVFPQADSILTYLDDIEPDYPALIQNRPRQNFFGQLPEPSNSRLLEADEEDEEADTEEFLAMQAEVMARLEQFIEEGKSGKMNESYGDEIPKPTGSKVSSEKRKQRRKQAQNSRKANRKKKK